MKIILLEWDSMLFGYPVGRLVLGKEKFNETEFLQNAASYRLVYVRADASLKSALLHSGDTKITFQKHPEKHKVTFDTVMASADDMDAYKRIGRQSGLWSRFALDNHFQSQEFERLYDIWVERSINREIAFASLTVLKKQHPTSLITVGKVNEETAAIGLFAVSEIYRGKGIGSQLLMAADTICAQHGYSTLSVATQGKNAGACKVYEQFGFCPCEVTYIYNYWNEGAPTFQ